MFFIGKSENDKGFPKKFIASKDYLAKITSLIESSVVKYELTEDVKAYKEMRNQNLLNVTKSEISLLENKIAFIEKHRNSAFKTYDINELKKHGFLPNSLLT